MKAMTPCDNAYDMMDLSIDITWERHGIHHREGYFADHMNCWRDIFPGSVLEAIMTAVPGQTIVRHIPPGGIMPDYRQDKVLTLPLSRFHRKDTRPDPLFYETDRFVHHLDQTARQTLSKLYATLIRPGDVVLDLMAGWESHIPEELSCSRVHGIGLNVNELRQNPKLTGHGVQDLNVDPILLFNDPHL